MNDKHGPLIVLEGTDGSGKATQADLLYKHFLAKGLSSRKISFPCYDSPSSALVKMYLAGEFGQHQSDLNPFAASTFYAVDRYASFQTDWKEDYLAGSIIVADRYTTSNAVHQSVSFEGEAREEYLNWLYTFEYQRMGIPAPDLVLFLDVPTDITAKLRAKREKDTNTHADIHERDLEYMRHCRQVANEIADSQGWIKVNCAENGEMRSIAAISTDIINIVSSHLHV